MVAPGFDFRDFELFTKQQLLDEFPEHVVIIDKLGYDKLPND
jgi:predicted cupin superfamily sugar epimerase